MPPLAQPLIAILGAADPEMQRIGEVLAGQGIPAQSARQGRHRVYPGNAYHADPPAIPADVRSILAIECAWPGRAADPRVVVIDHHWPGDPGYGKPPAQYLEASSLGQLLHRLGLEPGPLDRMIAASDHCLGAACQGRCPGVDPAALREWHIASRARFLGRDAATLRAELDASCARVRALAHDGLADLRGEPSGTLAEAPLAAAFSGIAVLSRVVSRDGRGKIGLLGATPALVEAFLANRLVPGLHDLYGDPQRGFAGGYLSASTARKASP